MNRFVFDTDILTLFLAGHATVVAHAGQCSRGELALTIISVEEQLSGWYTRLRRAKKRDALASIYERMTEAVRCYSGFEMLSFPAPAIMRYEQLRATYRHIGKNDLRIAAIVLNHGDTLVTGNVRDFQPIPGLAIQDWSK